MKGTAVAALVGCAAIAPAAAFTGGASFASVASSRHHHQQQYARRRAATSAVKMMAIDPATVHSVGDYVNAVGSTGLDQAWLSHVMNGEGMPHGAGDTSTVVRRCSFALPSRRCTLA